MASSGDTGRGSQGEWYLLFLGREDRQLDPGHRGQVSPRSLRKDERVRCRQNKEQETLPSSGCQRARSQITPHRPQLPPHPLPPTADSSFQPTLTLPSPRSPKSPPGSSITPPSILLCSSEQLAAPPTIKHPPPPPLQVGKAFPAAPLPPTPTHRPEPPLPPEPEILPLHPECL